MIKMIKIKKYLGHKVKITYDSGREDVGVLRKSAYRGRYCLDYKYICKSRIEKIELLEA